MKRWKSKPLAFEDYLGFYVNRDTKGFLLDNLNKILSMHGLKVRKVKSEAREDLGALEMMSPKRSTIRDRAVVYSCAPLTLQEVKADIRANEWDECPIGSIVAVGSAVEEEEEEPSSTDPSRPISSTTAVSSMAAAAADLLELRMRRKRKRKKGGPKGKKRARLLSKMLVADA